MFISINPSTGQEIHRQAFLTDQELKDLLVTSQAAFQKNRATELGDRNSWISEIGEKLEATKHELAKWITTEMGKPMAQSLSEIEKCVELCKHYTQSSPQYLADELYQSENKQSRAVFQPLGVILGVMPWNFPFWQVFRFAVPTLLAGNSVVIKHAPNVGICAQLLQGLFAQNELFKGAYLNLVIPEQQVEPMLSSGLIRGVSLTGSSAAGAAVAKLAGQYLVPSLLELGGSNAFIVDESADMSKVLSAASVARLQNNGQSCIASKRFLVHHSRMEEFQQGLLNTLSTAQIGLPTLKSTTISALARLDLLTQFNEQVRQGEQHGAQCLMRKEHGQSAGFFADLLVYRTTDQNNPLMTQEIFGPCFVLYAFQNTEEAVAVTNSSRYGLSSTVWAENQEAKRFFIDQIEAGAVFINRISKSDPRFPFGGIKDSGYGLELGQDGIRMFTNKKLVIE